MFSSRTLAGSVFALIAVSGASAAWTAPWFCHDLNCPTYTVIKTTSAYEIRSYPQQKWVGTTVQGLDWDAATSTGFERLFGYISKHSVEMTAPVTNVIQPGQGPNCVNNFTVSFYLPYIYQDGTKPAPTPDQGTNVELWSWPSQKEAKVAVGSYSGWASDSTVVTQATALGAALQKDGIAFVNSTYVTAGYDSPFRLFDRHNEVWFELL